MNSALRTNKLKAIKATKLKQVAMDNYKTFRM